MARAYFLNGETLVTVDGGELGLAESPVSISIKYDHDDVKVNAFGNSPPELQYMGMEASITMTLVHFDHALLSTCIRRSTGGASAVGQLARAGTRMGAGGHLMILRLTSPIESKPWRFPSAYLAAAPVTWPLGVERSVVTVTWRAIAFKADPYGGGTGSAGAVVWDHT